MADELLLDYDPASGLKEWISTDETTGESFIRYEQDVSANLDFCKEQQANGWDKRADMWHAANIPVTIQMEWLVKHGVELWNPNHKEGVKRLLNDPDYRYLRVHHFIM